MKYTSMTKRVALLTGIMFVLAFVISCFILLPSIRRTKALKANVERTQTALEQDYQKTIQLRRSIRELDDVYNKVQLFKQSTLEPGGELTVITELESLASQYGIEQNLHVTFTDPATVPAHERKNLPGSMMAPYYIFSFLNHGTFEQQMAFLTALEHLPYYLNIDSLQWEQRGGEGKRVTLRFDARVYASNE